MGIRKAGEVHESYTMLTLNADAHLTFRRMHKPDPKLPKDAQDKRIVVLEADKWDQWPEAKLDQARGMIRRAPLSVFISEPAEGRERGRSSI